MNTMIITDYLGKSLLRHRAARNNNILQYTKTPVLFEYHVTWNHIQPRRYIKFENGLCWIAGPRSGMAIILELEEDETV
jgi:hypothetical protein